MSVRSAREIVLEQRLRTFLARAVHAGDVALERTHLGVPVGLREACVGVRRAERDARAFDGAGLEAALRVR